MLPFNCLLQWLFPREELPLFKEPPNHFQLQCLPKENLFLSISNVFFSELVALKKFIEILKAQFKNRIRI